MIEYFERNKWNKEIIFEIYMNINRKKYEDLPLIKRIKLRKNIKMINIDVLLFLFIIVEIQNNCNFNRLLFY